MKKYSYTLLLLFMALSTTQAQRMIPKQKGLEINAGVLSNGKIGTDYYLAIGMTVHEKNSSYQIWALEYTHQIHNYKRLHIPQETYTAEGGYSFYLFGNGRKNITLNAGITGVIGYETINRGEALLNDGAKIISGDHFIYGTGGRLTLETYLCDQMVLVLQGRTKMIWGTDLQQFRPAAGVGLRFNF